LPFLLLLSSLAVVVALLWRLPYLRLLGLMTGLQLLLLTLVLVLLRPELGLVLLCELLAVGGRALLCLLALLPLRRLRLPIDLSLLRLLALLRPLLIGDGCLRALHLGLVDLLQLAALLRLGLLQGLRFLLVLARESSG
jgi:hypothetical protein